MLNESKPSQAALALEAMKTLERVSEGQATKIVVPSDVTKITSLASIFTDISNEG